MLLFGVLRPKCMIVLFTYTVLKDMNSRSRQLVSTPSNKDLLLQVAERCVLHTPQRAVSKTDWARVKTWVQRCKGQIGPLIADHIHTKRDKNPQTSLQKHRILRKPNRRNTKTSENRFQNRSQHRKLIDYISKHRMIDQFAYPRSCSRDHSIIPELLVVTTHVSTKDDSL